MGKILHRVKYTTSDLSLKKEKEGPDSLYNQFGTYITSITPFHFSAKMAIMAYQDDVDPMNQNNVILSYIDGHDNLQNPELDADFSGNQEVAIEPILYNNEPLGDEVTFKYFMFCPVYMYQEVELPEQYLDVIIDQFNEIYNENHTLGGQVQYHCDSVKFGRLLKIRNTPFITRLFTNPAGYPSSFVFGNTDSTFIYNKEGLEISYSADFPFGGSSRESVIRSNNYIAKTIQIPGHDEIIEMFSTVSFDSENLIQIYAGADNLPYTSDDVFVYAPKYWERVKIKLELR